VSDLLHVSVAEALGWVRTRPDALEVGSWRGVEPTLGQVETIPRYDTDWSATGPLMRRLWIGVSPTHHPSPDEWEAYHSPSGATTTADDPLVAVCNLILVLSAAGKIKSERDAR